MFLRPLTFIGNSSASARAAKESLETTSLTRLIFPQIKRWFKIKYWRQTQKWILARAPEKLQ